MMAEHPKKPAPRRPSPKAGQKPGPKTGETANPRNPANRRPKGKPPAGTAPNSNRSAPPAKTAKGKQPPTPRVFGPDYRFGTSLTLSVIGLTLSVVGFAVLNQTLSITLSRGLDRVADPALAIAGGLLGGLAGFLIGWLFISRAKGLTGSLITLIMTAGLAGAGYMLMGQAINRYVDSTDPAQKQAALRAAFIHQSAVAGALQINGLPTDITLTDTRSLIAGLGALLVADPALYNRLDSNADQLAATIMARGLTEDAAWQRFQEAVSQTERDYNRYRQAANTVIGVRENVDREAVRLWDAVNQSARARWANYQSRRDDALRQLNARLPDFRDLLSVYFRIRQRGADMTEMENRYTAFSRELFGQYIDPQTWCGLSGCPGTLDFITAEATKALSQTFRQTSNGLTLELDETGYYGHPSVRDGLRAEVAESGVTLPPDWVFDARGRISLIEAARRDLPVMAETVYNRTIDDWFGTTLRPDLGYGDFVAQEGIQQLLRQSLRLPADIRIDPTINRDVFTATYYPRIERPAVDALAGDMQAPLDDFGDTARLTDRAERAMKTMLALPLALFAGGITGIVGFLLGAMLFALALLRAIGRLIKLREAPIIRINKTARLANSVLLLAVLGLPLVVGTGVAAYNGFGPALSPAIKANPPLGLPTSWAMRMSSSLQAGGDFAQNDLLGGRQFGLIPSSEIDADGFGFAYEYKDRDPTVTEEPPQGPAGLTGIRDSLGTIINRRETGSN